MIDRTYLDLFSDVLVLAGKCMTRGRVACYNWLCSRYGILRQELHSCLGQLLFPPYCHAKIWGKLFRDLVNYINLRHEISVLDFT